MVDVESRIERTAQWLQHQFRQAGHEEGWGQFVERDAGDPNQIGWYGTSAAVGLLSLAGETPPVGALEWLIEAWDQRAASKESAAHVSQTARLAVALLGLASVSEPRVAALKTALVQTLLERRLNNGTWGDWYVSDDHRSQWTSPDISALALIALSSQVTGLVAARELDHSANALLTHVEGIRNRDPEAMLLPLAAIALSVPAPRQSRKVRRLIRQALRYRPHPDDTYVVMYNYSYNFGGSGHLGRDYILMPKVFPYLLLSAHRGGIFGTITAAHGVVTASAVVAKDADYLFGRGRLSATLDQFLVAFGLSACQEAAGSSSRGAARLVAWLVQEENGLVRLILPGVILGVAAVAAADPLLFSSIPCPGACLPDPTPFKSLIRLIGIGAMTFLGRPLLDNVIAYIKIKRGSSG